MIRPGNVTSRPLIVPSQGSSQRGIRDAGSHAPGDTAAARSRLQAK
jgi:hypothetical protein